MAEALGLELHDRERVAIMSLTREGDPPRQSRLVRHGRVQRPRAQDLNRPGQAILTEVETAHETVATKVSLRSKSGPHMIDVNQLRFGGGHANAAGARIGMPIEQAKPVLIDAILQTERESK